MTDARGAIRSGLIKPSRSLGQNFLTDRSVAERIVNAAKLTPGDHVIEVGPGVCALTEMLCERAGTVTAVEIDRRLVPFINDKMARYKNFRLINADIFDVPPEMLLPKPCGDVQTAPCGATPPPAIGDTPPARCSLDTSDVKLVSNLPYNIASAVILRFIQEYRIIGSAVLMAQKEVAERLVAKPSTKGYGSLTVAVNFICRPAILFHVPPHCFVPQPDVDSSVVGLSVHTTKPYETPDDELFFRIVRASFAHRRKTLANNLIRSGILKPDRGDADAILASANIPPGARGEALDIGAFANLTRAVHRYISPPAPV